jgi:histone-lysine N-methyltransferase SETMAR
MKKKEIVDNIPGEGCPDLAAQYYEGCKCLSNSCNSVTECTCLSHLNEPNYIDGRLRSLNSFQDIYPINECNQECECTDCGNRVVQNGPTFTLDVIDCSEKGKGLQTKEFIPRGSFVIEYLGELVGIDKAEQLLKIRESEPNYIMFLREHFMDSPYTVVIDAKNYSNKARFINHSCEPNLIVIPVRIDNLLPHAALFALRDIQPNEELSYDYNQCEMKPTENSTKVKPCFCGSVKCRKYLPNTK